MVMVKLKQFYYRRAVKNKNYYINIEDIRRAHKVKTSKPYYTARILAY